MNWIYYLLEANLYLTVFYALYYLTLKNETYYQLNRAYLLFTSALAFVIPFFQLGFLKPVYDIATPEVVPSLHPITVTFTPIVQHHADWNLTDYLLTAYISICSVLAIHLVIKIYSLIRLSHQNKAIVNNSYRLVELGTGWHAFSFFNYLFISGDQPQKQTVINHELIHIKQKHSWDILYLQLLKIINWFNPVVYLLQHSIKEQHEFIADRETSAREENASAYATFLLNNIYGLDQSGLTNTFFSKSLLKKRIIMLHQKPSGNLARLKYLAALPVCAGLLCASTLAFSKTYGWIDLAPKPKNDTSYTNKTVHDDNYTNVKEFTNAKGYKITEKTTLNNGNFTRTVTVTDKNGGAHMYDSKKATAADRKMLSETYGYKFPDPMVFNVKLLPPPPKSLKPAAHTKLKSTSASGNQNAPADTFEVVMAPAPSSVNPVPPIKPKRPHTKSISPVLTIPPVPPVVKDIDITAPKPPAEIIMNYPDSSKANLKGKNVKPVNQLFIINGTPYRVKTYLRPGEHVYVSGQSSMVYYTPGDIYAKSKWGIHADSGTVVLAGKPIISVK